MACTEICTEDGSATVLIILLIAPSIIGICLMVVSNKLFDHYGARGLSFANAKNLMLQSAILIIWFGFMSYGIY